MAAFLNGTEASLPTTPPDEIKYALPVDELESRRLDLQHHIFYLSLENTLHLAPLGPDVHNVLDLGTGTGFWAIDFAKLHPKANVVGSDSSPLERPQSFVRDDLRNLKFELADAEEEWKFDTKFDYIHGRMLQMSFRDVKGVFEKAFQSLQPGGILEMQDIHATGASEDGSADNAAFNKWCVGMRELGIRRNHPWGTEPPNYKRYMEEVGFVDIHVQINPWPFGPWMGDQRMKEIGNWQGQNTMQFMRAFDRRAGIKDREGEAVIAAVQDEMKNPDVHMYAPLYIVWGRKPLDEQHT